MQEKKCRTVYTPTICQPNAFPLDNGLAFLQWRNELLEPIPRIVVPEEYVKLGDELSLSLTRGHLSECLIRLIPEKQFVAGGTNGS